MRKAALAVGGVTAALVVAAAVIAGLLIYYRPTIEYSYVNIIDNREGPSHPLSGGVLVAPPLAAALLIWLGYRLWKRNATR